MEARRWQWGRARSGRSPQAGPYRGAMKQREKEIDMSISIKRRDQSPCGSIFKQHSWSDTLWENVHHCSGHKNSSWHLSNSSLFCSLICLNIVALDCRMNIPMSPNVQWAISTVFLPLHFIMIALPFAMSKIKVCSASSYCLIWYCQTPMTRKSLIMSSIIAPNWQCWTESYFGQCKVMVSCFNSTKNAKMDCWVLVTNVEVEMTLNDKGCG